MNISLRDVFYALLIFRKQVFGIACAVTALFFLVLYFGFPLQYISRASLLPPENSSIDRFSSLLQNTALPQMLTEGGAVNPSLSSAILKSRSAAEFVVRENGLQKYYRSESLTETIKKLQNDLQVEVTKEGILYVYVPVKTGWFARFSETKGYYRKLAASVTRSYVQVLDSINRAKLVTHAKRSRLFIESQRADVRRQLDSVEAKFAEFQKRSRAIALPEQMKSAIEAASRFRAEIMQTEINIALYSKNMNADHPALIALQSRLAQLRTKYAEFENSNTDILLSFKEAPELGFEYASLLRDSKSLNEVFLLLEQMYYKERIQENKDLPTVELLDAPIEPERESSPRILYSSFLCFLFSFFSAWTGFALKHTRLKLYKKEA